MTSTAQEHRAGPTTADRRAYLRLVLLGAAIGIPSAFVAALFIVVVRNVEQWLWVDLPDALGHSDPPWYLVIALPVAGAAVVAVVRLVLPGDGGHPPLKGFDPRPYPLSHVPGIALAAIAT